MDNTPKKLNKKLIISLLVLLVILIAYCYITNNIKLKSADMQINIYLERESIIIFVNDLDMGITFYNEEFIKICSLFQGCSSREPLIPMPIIRDGNDRVL